MIHKEHTDKLDLKQVANDFVSGDQHRCTFLDHLLLATKWVGVVGKVWLWPYHFKGACSGPDMNTSDTSSACKRAVTRVSDVCM